MIGLERLKESNNKAKVKFVLPTSLVMCFVMVVLVNSILFLL